MNDRMGQAGIFSVSWGAKLHVTCVEQCWNGRRQHLAVMGPADVRRAADGDDQLACRHCGVPIVSVWDILDHVLEKMGWMYYWMCVKDAGLSLDDVPDAGV